MTKIEKEMLVSLLLCPESPQFDEFLLTVLRNSSFSFLFDWLTRFCAVRTLKISLEFPPLSICVNILCFESFVGQCNIRLTKNVQNVDNQSSI